MSANNVTKSLVSSYPRKVLLPLSGLVFNLPIPSPTDHPERKVADDSRYLEVSCPRDTVLSKSDKKEIIFSFFYYLNLLFSR